MKSTVNAIQERSSFTFIVRSRSSQASKCARLWTPWSVFVLFFFLLKSDAIFTVAPQHLSRVGAKRKSHLSERWWWCVRACVCESFRSSHVGMAGGGIESGRKYHETGLKRCLLFSSAADKESVPSSQTEPPGFFLFLFVQFFACLYVIDSTPHLLPPWISRPLHSAWGINK